MKTNLKAPIDLKSLAAGETTTDINADLAGQPAGEAPVRWTPEYAASGGAKTTNPSSN